MKIIRDKYCPTWSYAKPTFGQKIKGFLGLKVELAKTRVYYRQGDTIICSPENYEQLDKKLLALGDNNGV